MWDEGEGKYQCVDCRQTYCVRCIESVQRPTTPNRPVDADGDFVPASRSAISMSTDSPRTSPRKRRLSPSSQTAHKKRKTAPRNTNGEDVTVNTKIEVLWPTADEWWRATVTQVLGNGKFGVNFDMDPFDEPQTLVLAAYKWRKFEPEEPTDANAGYLNSDTFYNAHSFGAAQRAAGAAVHLVKNIASGRCGNGMALVRPPGHHCERDDPMGFCLFNNVAVAVKWAKRKRLCNKVLIVDWYAHFHFYNFTFFCRFKIL